MYKVSTYYTLSLISLEEGYSLFHPTVWTPETYLVFSTCTMYVLNSYMYMCKYCRVLLSNINVYTCISLSASGWGLFPGVGWGRLRLEGYFLRPEWSEVGTGSGKIRMVSTTNMKLRYTYTIGSHKYPLHASVGKALEGACLWYRDISM